MDPENKMHYLVYVNLWMFDLPEEIKDEYAFGDEFLFAESMPLKKKYNTPITKTRGSYRKYNVEQIEKLFDLIIEEGFTTKDTAIISGINTRTALNYLKMYNNDPQKQLLGSYSKPRGRPCSNSTEEHSKFLVD